MSKEGNIFYEDKNALIVIVIFSLSQVPAPLIETARQPRSVRMAGAETSAVPREPVASMPYAVLRDTESSVSVPRTSLVTPRWSV